MLKNNITRKKNYHSVIFDNKQNGPFSFIKERVLKTEEQLHSEDFRAKTLHKAVQNQKAISEDLSLKLFHSSLKGKRTLIESLEKKRAAQENAISRQKFLDRSLRRKILGIDEADLSNHMVDTFGLKKNKMKRKKVVFAKKGSFQACDAVRQKYHIKGFAAKISHSLGKKKEGIHTLTKFINTDLFKL